MDIYDSIVNFIKMKNTGALLIVGAWGSGKTYYIDNIVFEKIKGSGLNFDCIRVSLFGVKNTADIPYRVFQAYTDSVVKEKTRGAINFESVREWSKRLLSSFPKLKEYVDFSPLFTKGNAPYSLLPESIIVCFDDIERATENLDINEILGAVNELVENRHFKVILVANKEYIDKKMHSPHKPQHEVEGEANVAINVKDDQRELFYEKVVEKTLVYEPDIVSIYRELVNSYGDSGFTVFMTKQDQQAIVDPTQVKNKHYRKQLQNIRTLKFAIEHFYQVWKEMSKDRIEEADPPSYKELHNYWLFIHAIAIEQKAEHLKYEDDRGLSQSLNIIERVSFGDEGSANLFNDNDDDDDEPCIDNEFVKKFKRRHFEPFGETFVFYQSLYDFLIASKPIDVAAIRAKANDVFKHDGSADPAYDILNTLLTKGIWSYTNEEAPTKLLTLLNAVENGRLNDYVSYFNAGVLLFVFNQLFGKKEEVIKTSFSKGIELFTKTVPEVSAFTKTQISILPTEAPYAEWIKKEMDRFIDERIREDHKLAVAELERQFMSDMALFTSSFAVVPGKTPAYFQVPILGQFNLDNVIRRIATLEPADVMQLYSFINFRYLTMDCKLYDGELPFLEAIYRGVEAIDKEKQLLSNYLLMRYLKPSLDKALRRLRSSLVIDKT